MSAFSARGTGLAWMAAAVLLTGCAKQQTSTIAASPVTIGATLPAGFKAEASILDLMQEFVDPAADDLWESVAIVSTKIGVEEHHPRTDDEWKAVRRKALLLVEIANLLATEGRPVAHPGQKLSEPGGESDFTPEQAQAEINENRTAFVAFTQSFQVASRQLLSAIDQRNVDAFLEAGGTLDDSCEGCHQRFWYPNSPRPSSLQ